MFTFLFGQYRRDAVRAYRGRLAALYLALASLIALFALALFVPAYTLVSTEKASLGTNDGSASDKARSESAEIESEVRALKDKLSYIQDGAHEIPIVSIIEKIAIAKEPGISLGSISLRRGAGQGAIAITGVAATREALVAFSRNLQGNPSFSSVNLPVSSLAKSRDVQFSITIDSSF